jgi:hypothetical protein
MRGGGRHLAEQEASLALWFASAGDTPSLGVLRWPCLPQQLIPAWA